MLADSGPADTSPAPPCSSGHEMENPAFERDGGAAAAGVRNLELEQQRNGYVCTDLCRARLERPPAPEKAPPASPWSPLKTAFLATIVGVLVLWVVVFATLSQLGFF